MYGSGEYHLVQEKFSVWWQLLWQQECGTAGRGRRGGVMGRMCDGGDV